MKEFVKKKAVIVKDRLGLPNYMTMFYMEPGTYSRRAGIRCVRGCGRRSSKANSKHAAEEYTRASTERTDDGKHHRRSGSVPVQPYVI